MMFAYCLIAQAAQVVQAQPSNTGDLAMGGIVTAIVGAVIYFVKQRFGLSLGGSAVPGVPAFPDAPPLTNRPILDWMTTVAIAAAGNDPLKVRAIKEQVEAIKAILDAANIPSPLAQKLEAKQ